jgi:glycerol uptake facilitator-like aquaporin
VSDAAGRPDLRCYVAEALGTFALVAIGPGAAMVAASTSAFGHAGVALAFGLAVSVIVAASGHLGGAHINPAVTLGFWSVRRFPSRDVVPYIVAQCIGAIAASALLGWLLGPVGNFGATVPSVTMARAFVIELGYTGLLGFVIITVCRPTSPPSCSVQRSSRAPWSRVHSPAAASTRPARWGRQLSAASGRPTGCTGRPRSSA